VRSPADAGMAGGPPCDDRDRVELEDVGGRTEMVMTHAGLPADSAGAAGWTMALDKLTSYVEAARPPSW
jgi:hypothetical protein